MCIVKCSRAQEASPALPYSACTAYQPCMSVRMAHLSRAGSEQRAERPTQAWRANCSMARSGATLQLADIAVGNAWCSRSATAAFGANDSASQSRNINRSTEGTYPD